MKRSVVPLLGCFLAAVLFTACETYEMNRETAGPASVDANEPGMQDMMFVRDATTTALHEIEMGRLGVERAQNLDLQLLAQKIFDDHDRAYKQLTIIAQGEEIPVPEAEAVESDALDHLQDLSGPEFDRAFLDHLLAAHRRDIKKFEAAARNTRSSEVRDFAARTLPVLREHLRMAENIEKIAGLGEVITEPAGAERPPHDPFYQGDPERRHQFDIERQD